MKKLCRKKLHDKSITGQYSDGSCVECHKAYNKDIYQKTREERLAADKARHRIGKLSDPSYWIRRGLKARYGITKEEYERRLLEQDGVCFICKAKPKHGQKLHIDHCHQTGRLRKFLCLTCNAGIGQMNDDPILLRKAAAYIEAFRP